MHQNRTNYFNVVPIVPDKYTYYFLIMHQVMHH